MADTTRVQVVSLVCLKDLPSCRGTRVWFCVCVDVLGPNSSGLSRCAWPLSLVLCVRPSQSVAEDVSVPRYCLCFFFVSLYSPFDPRWVQGPGHHLTVML